MVSPGNLHQYTDTIAMLTANIYKYGISNCFRFTINTAMQNVFNKQKHWLHMMILT